VQQGDVHNLKGTVLVRTLLASLASAIE